MARVFRHAIVAVLLIGCRSASESPAAGAGARPGPAASPRDVVAARYRLPPDARVLLAAADVARLLGGPSAPVTAAWDRGRWRLTQGAREVGRLPELPSYADCARLLDGWAATFQPAPTTADSVTAPAEPLLSIPAAFALARGAGKGLAGPERRKALADGVHALASLALQVPDPMGRNDVLGGRAWALVTIARRERALAPADEVLVAAALGYGGAARTLAAGLPDADPVRAFASGDDATLARLTTPGARLLRLRALVAAGDAARAAAVMRDAQWADELDLSLLAARLELRAFDDVAEVASATPALLALHARQDADPPASPLGQVFASGRKLGQVLKTLLGGGGISKLDRAIAALPGDDALGPFLAGDAGGRDLVRGAYRALGYAAIYGLGTWAVSMLGSMPAADALGGDVDQGGSFADAAGWLRLYRGAAAGSLPGLQLAAGVERLPFAGRAIEVILDGAIDGAEWGGLDVLPLARVAMRRLDTRLSHRTFAVKVDQHLLVDMAATERLARSIVAEDPDGQRRLRVFVARLDGRLAELRPLLRDTSLPADDRLIVLRALLEDGAIPAADARAEIDRIGLPKRWAGVEGLVGLLEKQGQPAAARSLAEAFLRASAREGLDPVLARVAVARTLHAEKRHADAWKAIEPAVASQQRGAMARGALILQALGRGDEALALAQQQLERYPTVPDAVGVVAEIHWRANRPVEAARLLARPPRPLTAVSWRWELGPRLVAAVDDGADAGAIFEALAAERIDPNMVRMLVQALGGDARREALQLDLYRGLRLPGMMQLESITDAASVVQRSRGPAAAVELVRAQVPPPLYGPLSQFAYARNLDEVLWSVIPRQLPGPPDGDACVWLFRAGASLRRGAADPRRAEVVEHYRQDNPSRYHTLGRHLVALADEAAVLALATSPKESSEVAYWLGVKADAERRIEDAVAWYRVAVELGQPQVFETRLAYDRLAAWRSSGKSLARLAKEGDAPVTPAPSR